MRTLTLVFICSTLTFCQSAQANSGQGASLNKYIDALVTAPHLPRYSADGAADVSVTSYDMNDPATADHHIPAVLDIINLKQRAIPLLIAHLDDMRPTSATFYSSRHKGYVHVPVGYVCLDLLTNIVKDTPAIFVKNCADDGLGACVKKGYYFWPDAYSRQGKRYLAHAEVYRAKVNWQRAYGKGRVRYQYPRWWKPRI